ncbi:carbohydrate ABC transporter permease [Streptomyces cadmiisoli]|uniref:Carbohydrate ABC transporter permease n=1 Tax=Streptomyces cadmiisoli TaxID=2184053 RepID=A0A2Z4IRL9_9ACTN|nr:carbohydrate ABC transporter permease [Streptomyces cadmiisoli]AWW35475.1 carbohydrate ABC transporter permease [Streptomyces cadmiisoli]
MSATTDTSATATARRDGYAARDRRTRRTRGVTYVLLGLGLLITTAPFLWMGLSAFKTPQDLSASPPVWIPTDWTLANFSKLFDLLDVPRYFFNSTLVALIVTLCNLLFCSMLGYALAKLNFAGKKVIFGVVMGALMVPGNLMLMPQFVMVSKMNLLDTYAALVLPSAAGAFGVFLMRQFMSAVPDELLEAARVDGAREWYIFWRIVIPQVKPALATLSIFVFLGSWNNFLWPLIATNDVEKYTLPVALATFATDPTKANGSNGVLMAGAFLVVLPVLAVFIVLQRYFTQSIATAGIK